MKIRQIFVEGGGDGKLDGRCREGFKTLLEKCEIFEDRMPRVIACGSRMEAFSLFKAAFKKRDKLSYIALLVDSEDPVGDIEKTWAHLKKRDGWDKPSGAEDANALLMTTCMETWIVADQKAITQHFDPRNQKSVALKGLPASNLETRHRHSVQDALVTATKNCTAPYAKGKRSFEVLAKLDPKTLSEKLPSFARVVRILNEKL